MNYLCYCIIIEADNGQLPICTDVVVEVKNMGVLQAVTQVTLLLTLVTNISNLFFELITINGSYLYI